MNDLIYPNEKRLGALTLGLGLLIWLLLIVGTFGLALVFVLFGFLVYLVTQSMLISHLKGNGVEISEEQCPELYAQFMACCRALQVDEPPKAYLLHGGGELNAFATKFLGTHYVVLLSSVVDAMAHHPDGVRFYIGHELGHIRSKHLGFGQLVRWPALWLPLIGAAYSRARESTCDRHGRACCQSAESATRALTALAAGTEQWKEISLPSFVKQAQHSSGFWMSLHELLSGYPWLTKRALRIMDPETAMPKRNSLAYLPALFLPYSGRLGAGFSLIVLIYILGVGAAVAIPAYHDYTVRAKLQFVTTETEPVRQGLKQFWETNGDVPASLSDIGIEPKLPSGNTIVYDPEALKITVTTPQGDIIFAPRLDDQKKIQWVCEAGKGIKASHLPKSCREADEPVGQP